MKVNVVSFSSSGGAGNVANSLVEGLLRIGLDANLIVATKSNLRSAPLDSLPLTVSALFDNYLMRSSSWDLLISATRDSQSAIRSRLEKADLTVFRWMNGLLGNHFMKQNKELSNVVWALDDMNPFTGVCHYSGSCEGFRTGCSNCPALRRPFSSNFARSNLVRKKEISERMISSYVAPTDWIQSEFLSSELGLGKRIQKIHNPLKDLYFETRPKIESDVGIRRLLIVAANLDDPIKGIWDVAAILDDVSIRRNVDLTMVGRASSQLRNAISQATFTGVLTAGQIVEQMRSKDLLLVPSLFENAGTVVAEAASQGLPTLARNVGGMPEMTGYGELGYLFDDSESMKMVLDSIEAPDLKRKGLIAKEWAQGMKPEIIARRYADAFL